MHTQIVACAAVLFYLTSIALTTRNVRGISVLAIGAVGARSHQFRVLRIGQALAARGHNFTLLMSDQDDIDLDKLGPTALVGLDLVTFRGPPFVGIDLWNQQLSRDWSEGHVESCSLQEAMLAMALALYADKDTLQKLRAADYDVLLQDAMYWPASLLEDALNIPSIDVFSFAPLQPIVAYYGSIHRPAAYLSHFGPRPTTNVNLLQRRQNCMYELVGETGSGDCIAQFQDIFKWKSGRKNQTYEQGYSSSVAGISAGDWAIEFPHAMAPKIHLVGPISADPAKALPEDLSAFVEGGQAAGRGAVYVSMGTASRLTEAELHSLAGSLSALPNPVLWKLAAHDLPVKAFVTHAGSNSIYEAGFHGKPVVCIPFLADQIDHAAKAAYHGFGLTSTPKQLKTSKPMLQALVRILYEPEFMANAQKVQKRLIINKPRHLAGLAADIVERVVTTGPEPYLEIRMPSLAWWQLALLDVKSIWHVIMTAACLAFFVLLCIAMCAMCWVMIVSASNEVAGSDEHDSVHEHES